jgi:hypothetical protein
MSSGLSSFFPIRRLYEGLVVGRRGGAGHCGGQRSSSSGSRQAARARNSHCYVIRSPYCSVFHDDGFERGSREGDGEEGDREDVATCDRLYVTVPRRRRTVRCRSRTFAVGGGVSSTRHNRKCDTQRCKNPAHERRLSLTARVVKGRTPRGTVPPFIHCTARRSVGRGVLLRPVSGSSLRCIVLRTHDAAVAPSASRRNEAMLPICISLRFEKLKTLHHLKPQWPRDKCDSAVFFLSRELTRCHLLSISMHSCDADRSRRISPEVLQRTGK